MIWPDGSAPQRLGKKSSFLMVGKEFNSRLPKSCCNTSQNVHFIPSPRSNASSSFPNTSSYLFPHIQKNFFPNFPKLSIFVVFRFRVALQAHFVAKIKESNWGFYVAEVGKRNCMVWPESRGV